MGVALGKEGAHLPDLCVEHNFGPHGQDQLHVVADGLVSNAEGGG